MNIANSIENIFKKVLPTPFTIAVLLTFFVFLAAFFFAPEATNHPKKLDTY
jgi:short-chain fatty acids transporter